MYVKNSNEKKICNSKSYSGSETRRSVFFGEYFIDILFSPNFTTHRMLPRSLAFVSYQREEQGSAFMEGWTQNSFRRIILQIFSISNEHDQQQL